ncbi:MAG TPA: cupredoxin domain-containing protein [Sphingomonas sp.]|nr:cupredoxin domain-containing protein [Sphingomonas sp.]
MRRLMLPTLLATALAATMGQAQSPDWSQARPVAIDLSNFKFTPSTLTLQHGTAYRIHLVNSASGGHDFVAREFFAGSTIAPEDQGKLKNGGIDLAGGETVDIRLVANQPGTFKTHCSHFMHSMFGMTGTITVQ